MTQRQVSFTRDDGETELALLVDYTRYRARRGARDGRYGPPIEPDEPAHVEIDGWAPDMELTEAEANRLSDELLETLENEDRYD